MCGIEVKKRRRRRNGLFRSGYCLIARILPRRGGREGKGARKEEKELAPKKGGDGGGRKKQFFFYLLWFWPTAEMVVAKQAVRARTDDMHSVLCFWLLSSSSSSCSCLITNARRREGDEMRLRGGADQGANPSTVGTPTYTLYPQSQILLIW